MRHLRTPTSSASVAALALAAATFLATPAQAVIENERESNETAATANRIRPALGAKVRGNIFPNGDLDFYSFNANAGDRVYAGTMTTWSSNASTDSVLDLLASDGVTVLETDNNDGSSGGLSSSIAGTTIPSTGTYYLRVKHSSATNQLRPYDLYVRLHQGAPTPETEDNGGATPQVLPAGGWVTGSTSDAADDDFFSIDLNAGDTVFVSLDLDPERDVTTWNGLTGLGEFDGFFLVSADAGADAIPSEAFFMTVKESGTYFVLVTAQAATFGTYHLSVSVISDDPGSGTVTTYTNPTPVAIPAGPGVVSSTISIPDTTRIGRVTVSIDLTHANIPDLDVRLISPSGNDLVLFRDAAIASGVTEMNLTMDDEAAVPIGFGVHDGINYMPQGSHRLEWMSGEIAMGVWTLTIHDDSGTLGGGTLNSWSVTVYEAEPPPSCTAPDVGVTVFSTDFEANDGGFTHSGTGDEWEHGNPTFAPVTGANSGANAWKTDLDNTYNASSSQDLVSPAIDLTGINGPIVAQWAQKYQMESASFDHAYVEVRLVDDSNPRKLWEWYGPTMQLSVGSSPSVTVNESAGWQLMHADISEYAGQMIELRFHLDGDSSFQFAGLAIDDVSVTGCEAESEAASPADLNGDGNVDVNDLLILIGAWGSSDPAADINLDKIIDVNDLLLLLGAWGSH